MTAPSYHGWNHRRKEEGGTDPAGVTVEHEGTLVGYRGAVDFVDSASVTWTVTDDEANDAVTVEAASAGGGGTSAIDLRNPSVGAFFVADALTNFTLGRWHMVDATTSIITGAARVPDSFTDLGVLLMVGAESGTGNARVQVATRSIADSGTVDSTVTAETAQTIAVSSAMTYARFPTSGSLGSTPAAGDFLVVQVKRLGSDGADSLTSDLVVWGAWLDIT